MEYDKGHLLNIYDAIKEKRENQKEYIKKVQDLDNEIKKEMETLKKDFEKNYSNLEIY